jgi:hypothetical protein
MLKLICAKKRSNNLGSDLQNYPCTSQHKGVFFASLGAFPVCPCCPTWTISAQRPFYCPVSNNTNWSAPLKLKDSLQFRKIDFNKSTSQCLLPKTNNSFMIFSNPTLPNDTTYLLVHALGSYVDGSKPTQQGGGSLGCPLTTCINMLIVDMWLQTDGSTNFKDADLTSIRESQKPLSVTSKKESQNVHIQVYNLQGIPLSGLMNKKSNNISHGCYVIKNGSLLKKQVILTPYK